MLQSFFDFLLGVTASWGYLGIFVLMAIESSFVPFPSEIVVPPAAYLAAQGEMSIFLVMLWAVLGSLVGAMVNYFLAMWLGRPLVYSLVKMRWARVFLLSEKKVRHAERYFVEHGAAATFFGRLVPAVRQLISLPAGFSRMHFGKFMFYTALGAGAWTGVLAALGYFFGAQKDLFDLYYHEVVLAVLVLVGAILILWALWRWRKM